MFEKLLKNLKENSSTVSAMLDIAAILRESRVYEFLREVGRSKDIHPSAPNYLSLQAMQTAWSSGYNQCLDDIMLFRERFLEADLEKTPPKMSFGGLELAVFKNDLTEEEANALRSGSAVPKLTDKQSTNRKALS